MQDRFFQQWVCSAIENTDQYVCCDDDCLTEVGRGVNWIAYRYKDGMTEYRADIILGPDSFVIHVYDADGKQLSKYSYLLFQ